MQRSPLPDHAQVSCSPAALALQPAQATPHTQRLVQNMGFAYLQRRSELVTTALSYAQQLQTKDEVAHDAILLMDRTMSTSLQVRCLALFGHGACFSSAAKAGAVSSAAAICSPRVMLSCILCNHFPRAAPVRVHCHEEAYRSSTAWRQLKV